MINIQNLSKNRLDYAILHWWLWSHIVETLKDQSFKFKDYKDIVDLKQHISNFLFTPKDLMVCFPCAYLNYNEGCNSCMFKKVYYDGRIINNSKYNPNICLSCSTTEYHLLRISFLDHNIKDCIKYASIIRDWELK